ncbi:MAG: hypothetical protein LBR15_08440 [Methanobrevibacter sp.]|nr:hypothetical protein [Candidatus Methanovirga australis]
MSENVIINEALLYAIIINIIIVAITQFLLPVIMCFINPLRNLCCGCLIPKKEEENIESPLIDQETQATEGSGVINDLIIIP